MEVVTSFRFISIASRPFGLFPYISKKRKNFHVLTIPGNLLRQSKTIFWLFGMLKLIIVLMDIKLNLTTTKNRFALIYRAGNSMIVYLLMVLAYRSIFAHSVSICHWLNKVNKSLCSINSGFFHLYSSNQFMVLYSLVIYLGANVSACISLWANGKFIDNWVAVMDSTVFVIWVAVESLFICQFIIFVSVARLFFVGINEKFEEEYVKCQSDKVSVTKLQELRTLHSTATDFYDYLHIAFELNLLFYISWAFSSILCSAVSVILLDVNDALTLIIWSTYHPCQIIPILYICDSVSREAKRAAHHLHELLSENLSPCIKEEVEIFSLQLQHRSANFNVYGFFDLNFSLLHSMVAAITTYTIALLQVPSHPIVEDNSRDIRYYTTNMSSFKNSTIKF